MDRFYYCYSPYLKKYLMKKGFSYITTGRNTNSDSHFWLYEHSPRFDELLSQYSNRKR